MAVSRAQPSPVSSHLSSERLSDHDDADSHSENAEGLNTDPHPPSYHLSAHQIPTRRSSQQLQQPRYYDEKIPYLDDDRPIRQDFPIHFDQYWKEFHQRGQRSLNHPQYSNGKMSARFTSGSHSQDAFTYRHPRQRQSLIKYVSNKWRLNPAISGSESSDYGAPSAGQVLAAPKVRRILYIIFTVTLVVWYWLHWTLTTREENQAIDAAIARRKDLKGQYFGTNLRPDFLGMKHMDSLAEELIPGNGRVQRLVIIGDVHGCHEELNALLDQLSFTPSTDHLLFTGDMIAKGPSSPAVIDVAIQHNASCVRGNHEDRILLSHRDIASRNIANLDTTQRKNKALEKHLTDLVGPSETDEYVDQEVASVLPHPGDPTTTFHKLDHENFPTGATFDRDLASNFTSSQIQYLKSCPVILHLGTLPPLGPTTVVHAGLVPGLDLKQQDPTAVMHMRTLDLGTYVPFSDSRKDGTSWCKVWEKYQKRLPAAERSTVIYGHDSKKGLQVRKWSTGLDTGCVQGGKLSALLYTRRKGQRKGEVEIKSVQCKDYRPKRGSASVELGQS